jgi:conjugative transfer region protein TrbK
MRMVPVPRPWRLAIALGATAVIALTTFGLARLSLEPEPPASPRTSGSISAELDRCRALGAAAASDTACGAVWRRSRERFLEGEGAR